MLATFSLFENVPIDDRYAIAFSTYTETIFMLIVLTMDRTASSNFFMTAN